MSKAAESKTDEKLQDEATFLSSAPDTCIVEKDD
jgi:hypothetical protein